jgi:hypothetical protein
VSGSAASINVANIAAKVRRWSSHSAGQNRRVNLILHEAEIDHGAVDILMPHGALRLHQVMVEVMIDPIGERLAHRMGAHLPGELVRRHRVMENAPGLHLTDGTVHPLAATKHEGLGRTAWHLAQRQQPRGERRLRLRMEQYRPPFALVLQMPAWHGDPIDHPPVLPNVSHVPRQQFTDAKPGLDAEQEERRIAVRVGPTKTGVHSRDLRLGEGPTALHRAVLRRQCKVSRDGYIRLPDSTELTRMSSTCIIPPHVS